MSTVACNVPSLCVRSTPRLHVSFPLGWSQSAMPHAPPVVSHILFATKSNVWLVGYSLQSVFNIRCVALMPSSGVLPCADLPSVVRSALPFVCSTETPCGKFCNKSPLGTTQVHLDGTTFARSPAQISTPSGSLPSVIVNW